MLPLDILSPTSCLTAAIVVFLSIVYYFLKNRDILPGPIGLPYLGLFPWLKDETCHLELQEMGKKYGDIFSFTYTGNLIINLGSIKAIREAHVTRTDCFAGRFDRFNLLNYVLEGGIAFGNGENWKVQRKFFIQSFKEYGLTSMRENAVGPVYDSVSQFIEETKAHKGAAFNVINLLVVKCTWSLRKVLFGDEGVTDSQIHAMNEAYAIALERQSGVNMLLIGPLGKLIFLTLPSYKRCIDAHMHLVKLLLEANKEIESKMDDNHPTCVVEDFFAERNKRKRNNDATWKYFTERALSASLGQIVGDGIMTVAYFIGCFLHALVEHPEEQNKIYGEIMESVGPNRLPTYEDRGSLPYTNSFIYEVIRTSNFFPLFPSMECTKETFIRGYRIPKGSITMLNIWQAHHDPSTYENPEKFDPSRFLSAEGKQRPELPIQFGMGKRSCTGEPFVMLQVFLYLTSTVQKFKVSDPKRSSKSHMFLMTGCMELCFTPREDQ